MSYVFSLSRIQRTLSCPIQYHLSLVGGYRQPGKMTRAIREKSSNTFLPCHEGSDSVLACYLRLYDCILTLKYEWSRWCRGGASESFQVVAVCVSCLSEFHPEEFHEYFPQKPARQWQSRGWILNSWMYSITESSSLLWSFHVPSE